VAAGLTVSLESVKTASAEAELWRRKDKPSCPGGRRGLLELIGKRNRENSYCTRRTYPTNSEGVAANNDNLMHRHVLVVVLDE
jgi:hypothetical protein